MPVLQVNLFIHTHTLVCEYMGAYCSQAWTRTAAQSLNHYVLAWQAAWFFSSHSFVPSSLRQAESLSCHGKALIIIQVCSKLLCCPPRAPSASCPVFMWQHLAHASHFRLISKRKEADISCLCLFVRAGKEGYEVLKSFMKINHQVKERALLMNLSPD